MQFQIRPVRVPDDFARMAQIFNSCNPEPTTPEEIAEWETKRPEGLIHIRLVAVDEQDQAIGFAEAERVPWMKAGKFGLSVGILPEYRHHGIGAALAAQVQAWALEQGATLLETMVRDHRPDAVAFAERRGFEMDRHIFESTLDPNTFDESRFAGVVDAVQASGIEFYTLAERTGEQYRRAAYEVLRASVPDIPGWDDPDIVPYETWCKWAFESSDFRPDCFLLAFDGDTVAGMTDMKPVQETGCLYTHYTGVKPEYRGRNIALALKLLAVRIAKEKGAAYMRTNNDSKNAPMLAVNRKLGYVPSPGQYRMRKQV